MNAVTEQTQAEAREAAAPEMTAVIRKGRGYLGTLALAALLIAPAVAFLLLHLFTPFDNGRLLPGSDAVTAHGIVVTPLQSGPPGFRAGDLVTKMEGQSLDALVARSLRAPLVWRGVGESVSYTVLRDGQSLQVTINAGPYPIGEVLRSNWGTILFALAYLLIAAFVFSKRPNQQAPRLLLLIASALICATTWSLGAQLSDFTGGLGLYLFFLTIVPGFMLVWIMTFHFALVFPRPLEILTRARWLVPLFYAVPYLLLVIYLVVSWAGASNTLDWISGWGLPADITAAVFLLPTLLVILWQYRRSHSGVSRQQMRWLVLAAVLVGGAALLFYFIPPLLGGTALDSNLVGLLGVVFPAAIAIAILRHNLFDIDTLLNRALVYGALTAVVLLIYIISVGGASALFQIQANWATAIVATGIVAVLFQPLRERLQRGVNRLMYGQRDEPFEVLSNLGQRLEGTLSPEMVYPTLVETVAETLKLPYAAIAVQGEDGLETAVSYGKPVADPICYPLTYQGNTIGQLEVAPRALGENLSEADERLLRNIAQQAGAAVHAVQLTSDLQRSRRQLVTAREEERRRLRRDLHDGLGPSLAALHLQSGVLRRLVTDDPQAAVALVDEFRGDIRATIDEIRRVVYELRPPALDELGLSAAVRSQAERWNGRVAEGQNGTGDARRTPLRIDVEAPKTLPPLPAAVEVAAYRIIQEALANVAHHAQASHCLVQLSLDGREEAMFLTVEIRDDGIGLHGDGQGLGLLSMRERAEELGGRFSVSSLPEKGTRVWAVLPVN